MSEYTPNTINKILNEVTKQLTDERSRWIEAYITKWIDHYGCTIGEVKLVVRPKYKGNSIITEYTIERKEDL